MKIPLKRIIRDARAHLQYPIWLLRGMPYPDNHVYKTRRIATYGKQFHCMTFIETGTFYGQTVNAVSRHYKSVYSIEIFQPLYDYNVAQFSERSNIKILLGDSVSILPPVIALIEGRAIFWLDGHYSGAGTGVGSKPSPLIEELQMIMHARQNDHCILIDDRRLLGLDSGYPSVEEVTSLLRAINPNYTILHDQDCIVAVPPA